MASLGASNVLYRLVFVAVVGCAPVPRDEAAPTPDAAPFCGDGTVPPLGGELQPDVGWETCDDGPRTGTPDSLCTKQCKAAAVHFPFVFHHTYLGFRPSAATGVRFEWVENGGIFGMAFIDGDGGGLVIAPTLSGYDFTPADDPTPIVRTTLVHVPTPARPVALGTFALGPSVELPIWVEAPRPGESAPRMYYATVDADLTVTVVEIPYPFPDGTKPSIHSLYGVLGSGDRHGVLLVDQSTTPPNDLLVAMVAVRSPTDVTASTLRVPASGRVRGAAVYTAAKETYPVARQVVQFFDDTNTFVSFSARPTGGVGADDITTYDVAELTRGHWPYRVVTGTQWREGCDFWGAQFLSTGFEDPVPVALLTDTGDIYTSRFTSNQTSEEFVTPYAHVLAGTRALKSSINVGLETWSWDPDGTLVYLVDSDCRDLSSKALRPQRYPGIGPWTTMFAPPSEQSTLIVDNWLVRFDRLLGTDESRASRTRAAAH